MAIEDEQLDEMLRDVSVPGDLKASLFAIADEPEESKSVSQTHSPKSYFLMANVIAAIAAS